MKSPNKSLYVFKGQEADLILGILKKESLFVPTHNPTCVGKDSAKQQAEINAVIEANKNVNPVVIKSMLDACFDEQNLSNIVIGYMGVAGECEYLD